MKKKDLIRVVIKRAGEGPEVALIENSLKMLQSLVGGYIEAVTLDEGIVAICNEEGVLMGLPYNCAADGFQFVGTVIFAGVSGEKLADCPLEKCNTPWSWIV